MMTCQVVAALGIQHPFSFRLLPSIDCTSSIGPPIARHLWWLARQVVVQTRPLAYDRLILFDFDELTYLFLSSPLSVAGSSFVVRCTTAQNALLHPPRLLFFSQYKKLLLAPK